MSTKTKEVEEEVVENTEDEQVDEKALDELINATVSEKMKALEVGKIAGDVVESFAKELTDIKDQRSKALDGKKDAVSFDEEGLKNFVEAVKKGQKADFTLELQGVNPTNQKSVEKALAAFVEKAVGPISFSDVNGANISGEWPQAELEPGMYRGPQREPFIEELVNVGTITSNLDAWIEVTDKDGNPAPVAELALIPPKDYDYARKTAEVKKIGVHAKYSAEIAEDLPSLVSELRNYLVSDLRRVVDVQLLSGDGNGENLEGILENAEDYDEGDFAGTIKDPNHFDVIETAANQVMVALHNPTHVLVHPTDRSKMRLAKGTDGHYVLPPFIASDGTMVSGLRVVANTGITAGKFLVGDFRKSQVKYKRSLTVEMTNTDQDDFVRDRFTVKATVRLVHRVKENDYEAFVYGDFAAAIADLEIVESP